MFEYVQNLVNDDKKYAKAMAVLGAIFIAAAVVGIVVVARI